MKPKELNQAEVENETDKLFIPTHPFDGVSEEHRLKQIVELEEQLEWWRNKGVKRVKVRKSDLEKIYRQADRLEDECEETDRLLRELLQKLDALSSKSTELVEDLGEVLYGGEE